MPNTIEKPIVPYNATPTKVVQREEYSLFAPVAANGRIGMAGFDPKHFDIKEQIVSLANSYINTLFRVVDVRGAIPEDISWNKHGKKTPNIAYKNSSYEVVTTVALNGTMKKSEKVGTLIVLVNESATDVFTEIFCADGQFYIRTYNDGEELTNLSFLPLIDAKRLTDITDTARAEAEEALSKSDTALSAITNATLTYSSDTGELAFAYYLNGEWVKTVELNLPIESTIMNMYETVNADGVPILRLELASGTVTDVTLDNIFHGFVTKAKLKSAIETAIATTQEKLPVNEGGSSHRIWVAAPEGFTDENGNVVKYYLKRIAGYDSTGTNASNGKIGVVTKNNRDAKVAEGLISTTDGAYENYVEHDEPYPVSIACRDKYGRLVIEDATEDFHAVNKRQLNTKLNKAPTTETYKVYGKAKNGQEYMYPIDWTTTTPAGNIVRRQGNGQIHVPVTPEADGQAASKKYVDDKVANAGGGGAKLYCHRISIYSKFADEEVMDNPNFGFTGVVYKSTATPIQSFEDITNEDLLSLRPNTFWIWDSPEENKFAYEFGKDVRTGVFKIGYIDGWEVWYDDRYTPKWNQIELYPSNISVVDTVTEV